MSKALASRFPREKGDVKCTCGVRLAHCLEELESCKEDLRRCREQLAACQQENQIRSGDGSLNPRANVSLSREKLLNTFLPVPCSSNAPPLVVSIEEIRRIADANDLGILAWQFAPLLPGESLQQHVQRQTLLDEACPGPSVEGTLKFISQRLLTERNLVGLEDASRAIMSWWKGVAILRLEWKAHLRNMQVGNYTPFTFRTIAFGPPAAMKAFYNIPAIIIDSDGQQHWGMIRQSHATSLEVQLGCGLRDLLALNTTRSCLVMVAQDSGLLLWQNSPSMALMGVHGLYNRQMGKVEDESSPEVVCDYMEMLFSSNEAELQKCLSALSRGETFMTRLGIVHPKLRSWMWLGVGQEEHHNVFITLTMDPVSLRKVYTVSQARATITEFLFFLRLARLLSNPSKEELRCNLQDTPPAASMNAVVHVLMDGHKVCPVFVQGDVTDMVLAQRQAQSTLADLAEEKQCVELLLQRQHDLIACISLVTDVGRDSGSSSLASELMEGVRMQIKNTSLAERPSRRIQKIELIGAGAYGQVHKGSWRGMDVAVKTMLLPNGMSGTEKAQRMAIMEAAICSSLSHRNIVKTHTYSLTPVMASRPSSPRESFKRCPSGDGQELQPTDVALFPGRDSVLRMKKDARALEVQIVLEFCDCGNLRAALDQGAFLVDDEASSMLRKVNYSAVLDVALDIAAGMQHLHSCSIVHSDLKACNVLLQRTVDKPSGVTAKVSDFGLSVRIDVLDPHVRNMFQGTLTHMAPEVLLEGLQSKASDMYAFGITLWELYSSSIAYPGIPGTMLGHLIASEGRRPVFPPSTPSGYRQLVEQCWVAAAHKRPSFIEVLDRLQELKNAAPCQGTIQYPVPTSPPSADNDKDGLAAWMVEEFTACSGIQLGPLCDSDE